MGGVLTTTQFRGGYLTALVVVGLIGAGLSMANPDLAAWVVLVSLGFAIAFVAVAWRDTRGSALRPSVAWFGAATLLAVASQVMVVFEGAIRPSGWSRHTTYFCALATLAALISVLNARRRGAGAWALLMGLFMLVLLIPWLESRARLHLEMPWSLFFGFGIVAGTANYVGTRFAIPAALVAFGLAIELLALVAPDQKWASARLSSFLPAMLGLASAVALCPRRVANGEVRFDRSWRWFRDRWGVSWSLRVKERFNREAELAQWTVRLEWNGLSEAPPRFSPVESAGAAAGTFEDAPYLKLRSLLRQFVEAWRLDAVYGPSENKS